MKEINVLIRHWKQLNAEEKRSSLFPKPAKDIILVFSVLRSCVFVLGLGSARKQFLTQAHLFFLCKLLNGALRWGNALCFRGPVGLSREVWCFCFRIVVDGIQGREKMAIVWVWRMRGDDWFLVLVLKLQTGGKLMLSFWLYRLRWNLWTFLAGICWK